MRVRGEREASSTSTDCIVRRKSLSMPGSFALGRQIDIVRKDIVPRGVGQLLRQSHRCFAVLRYWALNLLGDLSGDSGSIGIGRRKSI